jgi:nitrate reductase NapD
MDPTKDGVAEPCHIASLVVLCPPTQLDRVITHIESLPGLSVPESDPRGKLVTLMERPDGDSLLRSIRAVEALPGVLSTTLVYHQVDTGEI